MIAIQLVAATALLVGLILWRRFSPEFRRRSEQPKYQFLETLGIHKEKNEHIP